MAAAKKVEAKIRRLREEAFQLMSAEKYDRAVQIYAQLSRLDESNGEWARRAADCHWHLKNTDQRLKFSLLAAQAYSEAGLMLKAIAMCKVVLSIDPDHKETQEELARLHSHRPQTAGRTRPQGVKLHRMGSALAGRVKPKEAATAARRNSLRPTTAEDEERKAERTRTRLAAAAALRQARAQQRKDAVAAVRRKREDQKPPPPENDATTAPVAAPSTEAQRILAPDPKPVARKEETYEASTGQNFPEKVLGRIALKPLIKEAPDPIPAPTSGPPSSAFPPPVVPLIPSLRLEAPRGATPSPGLASLRLSERVPARSLDSLPPARGNVYSLTLADIPDAELKAARVPRIQLPASSSEHPLVVPVIPSSDDERPPDSIDTNNIGFSAPLSGDRLELSRRDFAEIPLLSDLSPDVLRQLITDVAMVELQTNEVLFNEGDPADAMYVVVEGSVTAVTMPHGEKPIQLAHLFEGDFFGEIGLMSDQPRGATISAHEPTRLLRFDRDVVAVLIEQDPDFLATLLQFLKDRLVEELMMSSPLFTPFNEQERYDLAEQFEFLEIEPDSILLERGQHPIGMYVLLTGEATMKGASEAGTIRRLGPGDIFGEQALLNSEVSEVEVRTSSKSFALCLPSDAFPDVIMTHPTVLEYLSTLSESSKGELDVAEDFLDHIRFF